MPKHTLALLLAATLVGCGADPAVDAPPGEEQLARAEERRQLEALASQVAADREAVAGFEVLHATYAYGPDPRSGQPVPTVKVALANGSPTTVARVSLAARFAAEGGGEPWLDQVFDVPLATPLASGSGDAVTMSPSGDSDWALRAPPDGVPVRVHILPLAVQTPDGKRLLTEHAFGDQQRRRLAELRAGTP